MDFLKYLSRHAHWGLRLSLAATFVYHGAAKLMEFQIVMLLTGLYLAAKGNDALAMS